jgi:predicted methyltransferase
MTVVEVSPGSGWYTEILAPALKEHGKFYAAFYPNTGGDDYYSKTRRAFEKKMAESDAYSKVTITDFTPKQANAIAPAGTADLVLTFRNLHNWKDEGVKAVFVDAFNALKAGGVLGVVEHRLPTGAVASDRNAGYYSQDDAIKFAIEVGFTLEATSEVNANPLDKADHEKGVWTLPPVLRLGEQDKEKYLAIGESDRMTLKFRKPHQFKK